MMMFQIILFVLSLSATAWPRSQNPIISYITPQQTRDLGGQVDLDCSIQNTTDDNPVLWVFRRRYNTSDTYPVSSGSSLIVRDSRFSLRFDEATNTYALSIKDIQGWNAGWYQCQVLISVNKRVTAEVELQVRTPPVISDNSTRSLVASEGESVRMECYADGFPQPKIYWHRQNMAVLPTGEGGVINRGNFLKIASVHKEDGGVYYCVAENGVGQTVRRSVILKVESAAVDKINH